jgi:hypothetical protein
MGRAVLALIVVGCGGAPSADGRCVVDGECPRFQLCDEASARCVSGCLSAAECRDGQRCSEHGRCVDALPDLAALDDAGAAQDAAPLDARLDDAPPVDLAAADLFTRDLSPIDLRYVDAWICSGVCPDAAREPNNTIATASVIGDSVTVTDLAICPKGDLDFYKITATRQEQITVSVVTGPCGGALDVDLLDGGGAVLGASTPVADGATASADVAKSAVVYARVRGHTAAVQNLYLLTVASVQN